MCRALCKHSVPWTSPDEFVDKWLRCRITAVWHIIVENQRLIHIKELPWWFSGKNLPAVLETCSRQMFDPWASKIAGSRKCQPAPACLPGESMDGGVWRAAVSGSQSIRHDWAHMLIYVQAWVLGCFRCVWLFVTLWTVAHQFPLSMG